jgi:hypothetical protein
MPRNTYHVDLSRWKKGFMVSITGPGYEGVTQTSFVEDAEQMARHYVATDRNVPLNAFDVVMGREPEPELERVRAAVFEGAYRAYVTCEELKAKQAPAEDIARLHGECTGRATDAAMVELMIECPQGAPVEKRIPRTQQVIRRIEERYRKEQYEKEHRG